uniref:Uncharacterized protein n=1 Tax=Arundo donax TaxID=35708 RepID=A0A0A8XTY6_ARUDO
MMSRLSSPKRRRAKSSSFEVSGSPSSPRIGPTSSSSSRSMTSVRARGSGSGGRPQFGTQAAGGDTAARADDINITGSEGEAANGCTPSVTTTGLYTTMARERDGDAGELDVLPGARLGNTVALLLRGELRLDDGLSPKSRRGPLKVFLPMARERERERRKATAKCCDK